MRAVLLAWAAGIWLLQQSADLPAGRAAWAVAGVAVLAACAVLASALAFRSGAFRGRWAAWRWLPCVLLSACLGFGWAAWRGHARLADALAPAWEQRDITVTGVVASLPVHGPGGSRFHFDVTAVAPSRAGVPKRLQLSWSRPTPALVRAGERWRFVVRLKRPHGFANWHGFDAEYWLLTQGIRATGQVRGKAMPLPERLQGDPGGWRYALAVWRDKLRTSMKAAMPADARYGGVLLALALGDRAEIAPADWQTFQRTGVTHLLAISGLHVTLVAGLAALAGAGCWRRSCGTRGAWPLRVPTPRVAALVGCAAALGYGALSGFGIPARRAVCMVAIFALAFGANRSVGVSYVLAWALAIIVAIDPWAVDTAGLWLSFGAVAVLVYAARGRRDGEGESLEVISGWRYRLRRHLGSAARAQFAVTLGMIPLSLAWFGQVSLVGPLANAVAIPVMALLVTPLSLGGLMLPSPLADVLLRLAHALVAWLAVWLEWLSAWPHAVWRAAIPPAWATGLALTGVAWCLAPRSAFPWERLRWLGAGLFVPALTASSPRVPAGEFRVTMIDIGQGNAVLVETAGHQLLYDAGPPLGEHSDAGERVIVPFLRAHGVTRLDRLVVSHAHADHYGGARAVIAAYPGVATATSLPPDHAVRQAAATHRTCLDGQRWRWDGVDFAFLHPETATLASPDVGPNGRSCVLRISNGRHAALLAGDIERPQEAALIAKRAGRRSLAADILLAPHHGSLTSSTPGFIRAVAPRYVVFQAGFHNRFAHPRPAVVSRYQGIGSRTFISAADGAVRFETRGETLNAVAYRSAARRYWMIR